MPVKLENYTCQKYRRKVFIKIPLSVYITLTSVLIVIALGFNAVQIATYIQIKGVESHSKTAVKQETRRLERRLGKGVLGEMSPAIARQNDGFYKYFADLAKQPVVDAWLNEIKITNSAKKVTVDLKGETEEPQSLHYLMTSLSDHKSFTKLPLRIAEVSASEQISKSKQRSRKRKKEKSQTKILSIYRFEITSEVPENKNKKGK